MANYRIFKQEQNKYRKMADLTFKQEQNKYTKMLIPFSNKDKTDTEEMADYRIFL
jgi:hypothetical protein